MANVVVTGGSGFLGSRLSRALLAAGSIEVAGTGMRPISRLTIIDRVPTPADIDAYRRVTVLRVALAAADVIFHLAAAVSGECEADFDLGLRANLAATESLLAACRASGTNPVVVFASSV